MAQIVPGGVNYTYLLKWIWSTLSNFQKFCQGEKVTRY